MAKIDIKVKKEVSSQRRNSNHLDLKKVRPLFQKQPKSKRLFLIFLILIILMLLIKISFFSPQPAEVPLNKLIPQEAVIFSLIEERALIEANYPFKQEELKEFNKYLNQANLDFQQDVLRLFKKPIAFASSLDDSESFILLLQNQTSQEQMDTNLNRLEQVLKNDYQFSYQIYRQNKIIILKPLAPDALLYYYSQIEDYLIMSNSLEWIEEVIDLIISD